MMVLVFLLTACHPPLPTAGRAESNTCAKLRQGSRTSPRLKPKAATFFRAHLSEKLTAAPDEGVSARLFTSSKGLLVRIMNPRVSPP